MVKKYIGLSLVLVSFSSHIFAWSNHSALTYVALSQNQQIQALPKIAIESLDSFLRAEQKSLAALFKEQDEWAKKYVASYPPLSRALAFPADRKLSDANLRLAFVHALRINPKFTFPLFVQLPVHHPVPKGATELSKENVTLNPKDLPPPDVFITIHQGQMLAPFTVLATAADEPDYGMDFDLWEDNGSEAGKIYGFGPQPFGNPAVRISSQAPFHMGPYHENPIVYKLAPFVGRTYPLLRIYQYATLAQLAFKTNHPYWGWCFTGFSLHYLQDLTQPYHASIAPSMSLLKMLWVNTLKVMGFPKAEDEAVVSMSNRHLSGEDYAFELLTTNNPAFKQPHEALVHALATPIKDSSYPKWGMDIPIKVASAFSYKEAPLVDALETKALPAAIEHSVTKSYVPYTATPPILEQTMEQSKPDDVKAWNTELNKIFQHLGTVTRLSVQGIAHDGLDVSHD